MKLRNKVAFVTGGTSGIGLETAKLFQAEGANVVLVGSNDARLAAAGKELNGKALLVRTDIRKVADIERAVEATRKQFGHIDIVFANAGATTVAPLAAVTEEYVAENLALNFTGTFFTIQKTAPIIAKGGSIIVTTSFLNAIGFRLLFDPSGTTPLSIEHKHSGRRRAKERQYATRSTSDQSRSLQG